MKTVNEVKSKEQMNQMGEKMMELFGEFGKMMNKDPGDEALV